VRFEKIRAGLRMSDKALRGVAIALLSFHAASQACDGAPIAALQTGAARNGTELAGLWRAAGFERLWGVAENLSLVAGEPPVLRLRYPAGSYAPSATDAPRGGAGFLAPLLKSQAASTTRACLHYEIRVPEGFRYAKGGKLPGLYGGDAPSGGQSAGEGGFSMRLMWRAQGALEAYAYVAGLKPGSSIGRGSASLAPGRWTAIDLEISLNDPQRANGWLRLSVDGRLAIERQDLRYRDSAAIGIDGLMFSSFFGGDDPGWASPVDQAIEFRDFVLYRQ
jgi:hypothetical protein